MYRNVHWPLVGLLALMAGLVGYSTHANRAAGPGEPAITATVDLERVFKGLNERADADAQLTALAGRLDAEGKTKREKIDQLGQDLDLFAPGSAKHQETSQELAQKGYKLQAYLEYAVRHLDAEKSRTLARIYDHIKAAVSGLARERGFDLVVVDDSVVGLPGDATEAETMRQISARRLLYTNAEIDITDDVIERMNQEFLARQGG